MRLTFLGTGGGRVNLLKQFLHTGGFRIDSKSANIHIDPGPGALIYSLENKLNIFSLDAVIVTHFHVDHCNDAALLIEAMSNYAMVKKGIFIGSKYTVEGDADGDLAISKYHLSKVKTLYSAKFGEKKKFKTKKGYFEIEIIKTKHDEPTSFGFKLYLDNKIIGYTGDTEYFSGIGNKFSGCDYLIINCLKPSEDGIPDHLKLDDAVKILKFTTPKKAFILHMGIKLQHYGLEKARREIEKDSGVKIVLPKDNSTHIL